MRLKIIVAAVTLLVAGAVIVLWIGRSSPPPDVSARPTEDGQLAGRDPGLPPERQLSSVTSTGSTAEQRPGPGAEPPGDLFRRKWEQDRQLLGPQEHDEMERLWAEGRKNRGHKQGIEQLEQLVNRFPNTNRAGCATLELGHSYVRKRDSDRQSAREAARKYWQRSIDSYASAICEHDASVPVRASLGLAWWVYRFTDRDKARRLLEEVIAQQEQAPEATPDDRMPPGTTARRLLESLDQREGSSAGQ